MKVYNYYVEQKKKVMPKKWERVFFVIVRIV